MSRDGNGAGSKSCLTVPGLDAVHVGDVQAVQLLEDVGDEGVGVVVSDRKSAREGRQPDPDPIRTHLLAHSPYYLGN